MISTYTLFKVKNGLLHYASVSIEVRQVFSDQHIISYNDCLLQEYYNQSVNEQIFQNACTGIKNTLNYFSDCVVQNVLFQIEIVGIKESITDTHDGDIASAASAVMWQSLNLDLSKIQILFLSDHSTCIIFPNQFREYQQREATVFASDAGKYEMKSI